MKPSMPTSYILRKIVWVYPGIPALFLFTRLQLVHGQFTTARCTNEFVWMSNDKGDSPCTVAAYMQGLCYQDTGWFVPSLAAGLMYLPPTREQVQRCPSLCNTVIYNLMSSCAACQKRDWATYSAWSQNCSADDKQNASNIVISPSNTSVPSWALVDSSKGKGTFDLATAYSLSNHGTGANPYSNDVTLSPAAIAGISVGVAAVILIALITLLYRRPISLLSSGTQQIPSSSRWRNFFALRRASTHDYAHVSFQGPPPSPIIRAKTRVASSIANSDFLIDKDTTEGPISPTTEATESVGGVQGRLIALFGHRSRQSIQIQTADLGAARDFTFVSSSASAPEASGVHRDSQERESFLPRIDVTRPRSHSAVSSRERLRDTVYPSDSVSVFDIPLTTVDSNDQRRHLTTSFLAEKRASSSDLRHSSDRSRPPSISTGSFILYPPDAPATAPYGADLAAIYKS